MCHARQQHCIMQAKLEGGTVANRLRSMLYVDLFVAKHGSVEYAALHDTMLEPATPVHNRVYCK